MALRTATRDVVRRRPDPDNWANLDGVEFREIVAAADFDWSAPSDRRWLKANILRSQWKSHQAWEDYDRIGEVHKAINRACRVGGYAKLRVVSINPDGTDGPTISTGLPAEIVKRIYAPYGGVRGLVDRFFALMKVPGDSYLIRVRQGNEEDDFDGYHFLSSHEVDKNSVESFADQERDDTGLTWITLPSGSLNGEPMTRRVEGRDMLGRVWLPGKRWIDEADSPLSALATECEVLWGLTETLKANIRNRFLLGGIMGFPSGIQNVRVPGLPQGNRTILDYMEQSMTRAVTRVDDAKSRLPILLQAKAEDLQGILKIDFDREIFQTDLELRRELIDRILFGLDIHTQATKGNEDANHFCLDDETEIFTRRGWQSLDTIEATDEVITLDHGTGLSSWAPISGVHSWDVVDEPMRSLESRTHSSLTTMKHRWPIVTQRGVRRWVLTEELNQRHAITTGAPCVDVPTIAKHSDALVELAAWFWTEGNVNKESGRVSIAQSHTVNPQRVDRIRAALTAEFGVEGFVERIQRNTSSFGGPITVFALRSYAGEVLKGVAPDRIVASDFIDSLTVAQLHLFIDVSCQGDGCSYRQGELQIWQRDPAMLDAFERACILAGRAVVRRSGHEGGTVVRAQRSTRVLPVKAADEMRRTGRVGATDEIVQYTGRIWCPTVPGTENFLARRRGLTFFTGNTAWVQSDEEVRIAIQPDLDTMCWALTRFVLHKELEKAGWSAERIVPLRIAWDLSESSARTNKQEDSRQAHDRGLASGNSVLRAAGLSVTDDRIPDWELIRLIGQKTQNAFLALVPEGTKIDDIDWSAEGPAALFGKVSKPGPNPASGSDEEPSAGPGVGEPGAPSEGERARTRRSTRTPSG